MSVWTFAIALLGSGFVGSLITLWIKAREERKNRGHAARRSLYVDLLTVLVSRREYMQTAMLDPDEKMPDIAKDRVDNLNVLLSIDATSEARALAQRCFALTSRFEVSRGLNVPIEVDQHGLYRHRYDKVRGVDPEAADLVMRMSLGGIADEFKAAVDALTAQVRLEVGA